MNDAPNTPAGGGGGENSESKQNLEESQAVRTRLAANGTLDSILRMRTVCTDKNDGLRTESCPLPLDASARLVVPGFKDPELMSGKLRTDAPTASRNSQFLLCLYASSNPDWIFCSGDVRAAFLKGKPYLDRELYAVAPNGTNGPTIDDMQDGQLIKILKGVFGLADAPR